MNNTLSINQQQHQMPQNDQEQLDIRRQMLLAKQRPINLGMTRQDFVDKIDKLNKQYTTNAISMNQQDPTYQWQHYIKDKDKNMLGYDPCANPETKQLFGLRAIYVYAVKWDYKNTEWQFQVKIVSGNGLDYGWAGFRDVLHISDLSNIEYEFILSHRKVMKPWEQKETTKSCIIIFGAPLQRYDELIECMALFENKVIGCDAVARYIGYDPNNEISLVHAQLNQYKYQYVVRGITLNLMNCNILSIYNLIAVNEIFNKHPFKSYDKLSVRWYRGNNHNKFQTTINIESKVELIDFGTEKSLITWQSNSLDSIGGNLYTIEDRTSRRFRDYIPNPQSKIHNHNKMSTRWQKNHQLKTENEIRQNKIKTNKARTQFVDIAQNDVQRGRLPRLDKKYKNNKNNASAISLINIVQNNLHLNINNNNNNMNGISGTSNNKAPKKKNNSINSNSVPLAQVQSKSNAINPTALSNNKNRQHSNGHQKQSTKKPDKSQNHQKKWKKVNKNNKQPNASTVAIPTNNNDQKMQVDNETQIVDQKNLDKTINSLAQTTFKHVKRCKFIIRVISVLINPSS